MGKDHTNIRNDSPYDFPKGKCAEEFKGEDYTKILEGNAPELDMANPPFTKGTKKSGQKESY